jgi:uncharacterized integral membrane protein
MAFGCFNSSLIQILRGDQPLPLSRAGVSHRWSIAERPFFDFMRNLKIIVASILAILVAIMMVQNREPVATHLLFATIVMPHAVLLFITAAAGFALGALLTLSLNTKRKQSP